MKTFSSFNLPEAIAKAKAAYDAMTPAQQARHDMEQRRSFVRGMCPSNTDFAEWCKVVDRTLPVAGHEFLAGELEKRDAEIDQLRDALNDCRAFIVGDIGGPVQKAAIIAEVDKLLLGTDQQSASDEPEHPAACTCETCRAWGA